MTARFAFAVILLSASTAAAFVLPTAARVEIVPHAEIAVPSPAAFAANGGGLRLDCPESVAAHVELVTDDGLGRVRHVAHTDRGNAWVRWEKDLMTCRLTVTIE